MAQNTALRRVLGAYKATPIRNLELETFCPPLDLYFNKRLVDFEARLENSGMGERIRQACQQIRGRPRAYRSIPDHKEWAATWAPTPPPPPPPPPGQKPRKLQKPSDIALTRDWKARWVAHGSRKKRAADTTLKGAFAGGHLRLYAGLRKAQSSVLAQMRTGKIGLAAFLYYRKVPGQLAPVCNCGRGHQTLGHLFFQCVDPRSRRLKALGYTTEQEVREALSRPEPAMEMAQCLLRSGWLREFQLSERIRESEDTANVLAGWNPKPPPREA